MIRLQEFRASLTKRENLFRNSVLFSVLFHLGLYGIFQLKHLLGPSQPTFMEIDLTQPFRIGGNPLLKPGGGTTLQEVKNPAPPAPMEEPTAPKAEKPKDWVLPSADTKILEKPGPEATSETRSPNGIEGGTGDGYTGTGGGFGGGDGEGGGIKLDKFPKLLNKREVLRLLKKNYPPAEREAGIQSRVIVDLHLDPQGRVLGVDVIGSGGQNFDSVAKVVADKMRFEPAVVNSAPVAVKIRQSIVFKLEEEGE